MLCVKSVLQLHRRHRQAVQEQHQVDAVLVGHRIAHLPHHPQAVGAIAGDNVGVHRHGRLELGEGQGLSQADHLHAVAQHIEGSPIVQLLADPVQQDGLGSGAVIFGQRLPGGGLGGLNPCDQIGRKQGAGAVVVDGVTRRIEPALGCEMIADLFLETDFLVQAHAACASAGARPRTSILPVTAAEIRALRRS